MESKGLDWDLTRADGCWLLFWRWWVYSWIEDDGFRDSVFRERFQKHRDMEWAGSSNVWWSAAAMGRFRKAAGAVVKLPAYTGKGFWCRWSSEDSGGQGIWCGCNGHPKKGIGEMLKWGDFRRFCRYGRILVALGYFVGIWSTSSVLICVYIIKNWEHER